MKVMRELQFNIVFIRWCLMPDAPFNSMAFQLLTFEREQLFIRIRIKIKIKEEEIKNGT